MSEVFVTSDIHFCHDNIIKYCNRPFATSEEMNAKIIEKWNKVVSFDDDVYILGDFALIREENHENKFKKLVYLTQSLNGNKYLLFGNHDYFSIDEYKEAGFKDVYQGILEIQLNKHWWNMCHYEMTFWNNSHRGSYHLFGHEHWPYQIVPKHSVYEEMKWSERKYNVCMDANGYKPVNINELVKILDERPTNFNKEI